MVTDEKFEYVICLIPIEEGAPCASLTIEGLHGEYITVLQSKLRPIVGSPEEIEEALSEYYEEDDDDKGPAEIIDFKPKGRPH